MGSGWTVLTVPYSFQVMSHSTGWIEKYPELVLISSSKSQISPWFLDAFICIPHWSYSTPISLKAHKPVSTRYVKQGCVKLCLTVYFLRRTCGLNAYITVPGTRHVELIRSIWCYPSESGISAATYDTFCSHTVERQPRQPQPELDFSGVLTYLMLHLSSTNISTCRIRYIICHGALMWTAICRWHFSCLK